MIPRSLASMRISLTQTKFSRLSLIDSLSMTLQFSLSPIFPKFDFSFFMCTYFCVFAAGFTASDWFIRVLGFIYGTVSKSKPLATDLVTTIETVI